MRAAERLQALVDADVLAPDLANEVRRLYDVEDAHEAALEELVELRRHTHRVTVLNGARRAALFLGEGFIRIRHHSRGHYSAEHIPSDRVTVRRGD